MDPKNIEALRGHGSAFLGKKDWDSAVEDFNQLIELDPHSAEAYRLRAQAYWSKGDSYRARLDATDAIRLKPDDALAYFYRADAYCKEKDFQPALANLAESVRLEKKLAQRDLQFEYRARDLYVEIHQSQASTYTEARQWEKAVDSLLAIRELNKRFMSETIAKDLPGPQLAQVNRQLARAYAERGFDRANRGEFPAAVSDLNAACTLVKDDAQIYRLCGLTCCKMARDCHARGLTADEIQQWQDAIKYLRRAIWLDRSLEYELRHPLEDAQRNLWARDYPGTKDGRRAVRRIGNLRFYYINMCIVYKKFPGRLVLGGGKLFGSNE